MHKTKLVKTLKLFSKSEIKAFVKFVSSLYGNGESKILMLLNEIIKYFPEFDDRDFTKKHLYKMIYPKGRYNDATLRKLISYLNNHAEEFLTHQGLKKDDFTRSLYLLKELSLRNSDTLFEQQAALIEKRMKGYSKNTAFYHNRFKFLNVVNSHYSIRKRSIAVDNYQQEADSFFHYFFIEALNVYIYLVNEKKISNRDFKLTLFDEVLSHLGNHLESRSGASSGIMSYSDIVSIPVYYNCLMLILTEEEKYFHILREIQKKLDSKIQGDELRVTYIVLQNFCVACVKKGIINFRREAFELQRESVLKGLHQSGERIHIFTFLNIVSEAVSVGESFWAENFIKENQQLIEPGYEFDVVNLSYAKCEFSRKEYEKALTRLGKINMESGHFKLSVKTLMLMIYYELDSYDSAISLLDTYKHFIMRNKLLPELDRQNHINFVRYYNEALSLKISAEGVPGIIRKNILASGGLVEKEWLLEKIEELKG